MMLCNSRCEFDGGIKEWGRVSSRTKWHTDCVSQQSACYILHFLFSRVYPGGSIYICYTVQMLIFYPKENLTRACRPASRSVRPWNFWLSVVYFRILQKLFLYFYSLKLVQNDLWVFLKFYFVDTVNVKYAYYTHLPFI